MDKRESKLKDYETNGFALDERESGQSQIYETKILV